MSIRFINNRGGEITLDWFFCKRCARKWSWPASGHMLAGGAPDVHMHCVAKGWELKNTKKAAKEKILERAIHFCREHVLLAVPYRRHVTYPVFVGGWTMQSLRKALGATSKRIEAMHRHMVELGVVRYIPAMKQWVLVADKVYELQEAYDEAAK